MTQQRPIITNMNGGELSPRMMGRVDTAIYAIGLRTCQNFVPTVEGPLVKRPGFEFIRMADPTSTWLSAFRFNLTQSYVLEWGAAKLRFFTNGARIETSPGVAYEVATPYPAAAARYVSLQQSYDRLYMDHASYPPAALSRTGGATFGYAALELANGPFADANSDETITVGVSAATGAGITLTASSAIFLAGHVGALFRIEAADFSAIPAWEVGIDGVIVAAKRRNEGKVYVAATAGRTGTSPPIHTSGTEWDGSSVGQDVNAKPSSGAFGIKWTYLHDRFGIVRITAVGSGTSATADVVRRLPDGLITVPSFRWAQAAFSTAAGWPNIVVAWGGRLIHIKRFDVLGSVAGDYLNHATFTAAGNLAADLAFRRTIATEDPVIWAAGDRKLVAGTASRELAIGAINAALALAGDNISAEPQSFYGSAFVWPLQLGTETFFVERGGKKLRSARYDFGQDRYLADNRTAFARHIGGTGGFIQLAYQAVPEQLMLAVRADGQIAARPHQPEQDPNGLLGFGRIVLADGGQVLSAVTIASQDGQSDECWALIQSDFGKWIGRMAAWREDGAPRETSFFVDAGVTAIAAIGQTHFSGMTHLAGKPVAVLADGGVVPGITIAGDGTFDLPATFLPADRPYVVTVGLGFTATATLLRPELKINGETSQGKKVAIRRIALRVLETMGLLVGQLGFKLDQLFDRSPATNMDTAEPLVTGDNVKTIGGGFDYDGCVTMVSSDPLPATIIAAMPIVDVEPPRG